FCPYTTLYRSIEFAGNREIDARISGARPGHARIAIEPVREHLVHPARVGDVVVQVERGDAGQLLAFELDLEGALIRPGRGEEGAVALVTHGNILEFLSLEFQVGVDVGELDA